VMGTPARPYQGGGEKPGWAPVEELKKQYDVTEVPVSAPEIPSGLAALIVIHPRRLPDETFFALDQFVLRGGHLLAFVDPLCLAQKDSEPEQSTFGLMKDSSSLNKLTKAWGIEFSSDRVVADIASASLVRSETGGTERLPTWLTLRGKDLNPKEIGTGALQQLMMPFAGAFTGDPVQGLTISRLLQTSDDGAFISSFEALRPGVEKMRDARPQGVLSLAIRLRGTFPTAFPGGPPGGKKEKASFLKKSSRPGVVVLVGDVDMLYDRFCVRTLDFLGQTISTPVNDNINFFLNMAEELSGSEALIGLRSRGTFDRPFTRVLALEDRAQKKWQREELLLTRKLQRTQSRLRELESAKQENERFILSPEQKREIERFRRERFETQKQLKTVRKNLRWDIEKLGLRLKILNMALIPLLVVLFGLYHGWRRKKEAQG